jgi:hypothetical protein
MGVRWIGKDWEGGRRYQVGRLPVYLPRQTEEGSKKPHSEWNVFGLKFEPVVFQAQVQSVNATLACWVDVVSLCDALRFCRILFKGEQFPSAWRFRDGTKAAVLCMRRLPVIDLCELRRKMDVMVHYAAGGGWMSPHAKLSSVQTAPGIVFIIKVTKHKPAPTHCTRGKV